MAWKLATSFVMTAETWLEGEITRSGEEAAVSVGCSRAERLGVLQRIRRSELVQFGPLEWLSVEQMDLDDATRPSGKHHG